MLFFERDTAQWPFGGVVAEADATIAEDAGKGIDALAHVSNALAT